MGRIAIVTGAASGIGQALAAALVARGDTVVVADADFLNLADIDGPTENNLPALLGELERLEEG